MPSCSGSSFHRYLDDEQRDEPHERLYLSLGPEGDRPLRHYLARWEGDPVGCLSLFLGRETAGVYNVEVAPEHQRRGVGAAMTRAILEDALQLSYQAGIVAPTCESRSLYARLGFVLHRQAVPMYQYPPKP